jgi:NAD-dependent dihydropyrimidine dehydrogenase PreA subunit
MLPLARRSEVTQETIVKSHDRRVFDLIVRPDKCCGCYTCQVRCSMRLHRVSANAQSAILIERAPNQVGSNISFTDECDLCTICALSCPYGALERVRKERGPTQA